MQNQARVVACDLQRAVLRAPPPFTAIFVTSFPAKPRDPNASLSGAHQKRQDRTSSWKDPGEQPGNLGKAPKPVKPIHQPPCPSWPLQNALWRVARSLEIGLTTLCRTTDYL